MLQRAENVSVYHQRGFFGFVSGRGQMVVVVGKKPYRVGKKSHKAEFARMLDRSQTFPVPFVKLGERRYWRFGDRWYWDNEDLSADAVHALLVARQQRREATISRAKSTVAMSERPTHAVRGAIPEDVKQLVWTRDQGRCRLCGSNVELQFDHIIPFSMGGATSPENIQVLCGPCNRTKGASVSAAGRTVVKETAPPPGWYPDPSGAAQQRYWDGVAWTEHERR